jgi:hypothetical protein
LLDKGIAIDPNHGQAEASHRATRYGILGKTLDVGNAIDRSFTAGSAGFN